MIRSIFLLAAFFLPVLSRAQGLEWTATIGSTSLNEEAVALALDSAGHVYNAGYFSLTADFDPSAEGILEFTSAGQRDGYIQKLDPCIAAAIFISPPISIRGGGAIAAPSGSASWHAATATRCRHSVFPNTFLMRTQHALV